MAWNSVVGRDNSESQNNGAPSDYACDLLATDAASSYATHGLACRSRVLRVLYWNPWPDKLGIAMPLKGDSVQDYNLPGPKSANPRQASRQSMHARVCARLFAESTSVCHLLRTIGFLTVLLYCLPPNFDKPMCEARWWRCWAYAVSSYFGFSTCV